MHELSLARGVVDMIEAEAVRQNFSSVRKIVLEIGALSCVDEHALRFGMDASAKGTLAADAAVDIVTAPGKARCFECDNDVVIENREDGCPVCGSHKLLVTGGEDMTLKALEVD